jgi:cysteine sulfinate desulfinase/cysteine desulfurase-like protein
MKLPGEVIDGAFRVSLSRETTVEEVDAFLKALEEKVLPFRLKGKKF